MQGRRGFGSPQENIWVSIGNKQLEPPTKKVDPHPHENFGSPWKRIFFFEIVVVGEYSILFYCNRKDHGDSRSITKTTPGCLEDRTRGSDQWEAEAGKC